MIDAELLEFLRVSYPDGSAPKPLNLIFGAERVRAGEALADVARSVRTTARHLQIASSSREPARTVLGVGSDDVSAEHLARTRKIMGGLILGRAAEIAFEDIYRTEMPGSDFELVDMREGRSDTDYRMLNGGRRPIYRINIKFFGSVFRRGVELVGLDPEDCFPLATYKIDNALRKQDREHLPYIFVIVGVPDLRAENIADIIEPSEARPLAWLLASKRITRRRELEDKAVDRIVETRGPAFEAAYQRIRAAEWYVLSARRADRLLRQLLFERVYALKVRNFAQAFRGAELDMHFSLKKDLVTLSHFLEILRTDGQTRAASMLERGDI